MTAIPASSMATVRLRCDGCRKAFVPRSVGATTIERARLLAMRQGWLVGCVRPGSEELGELDYCARCREKGTENAT